MTDPVDRSGSGARVLPFKGGAAGGARTDDQLLRTFLAGDQAVFGELFRRHEPAVFAIVRRYARGSEDGRDLTQRAFLKAFEAARRGLSWRRGEGHFPFRAWLLRIAVNLGRNHARDSARWPRAGLEVLDGGAGAGSTPAEGAAGRSQSPMSAEEELLRTEQARQMRAAVLDLPRRQREVLTLRIDAELSFAEVGEVLGITESNARVQFHHAARRLRAVLAPEESR
jgi:RNA polymerase sigma-70 factor (ECF subfamily)